MQTVIVETKIAAPIERCFLLSLSIDLHMQSTAHTRERAIAGVTHGLIGLQETVTWQGRHFGFMLKHKTLISRYEKPCHFQDIMLEGMFRSFEHDHYFEALPDGSTQMRDGLRFDAPLGPLGWFAETLVLGTYFRKFLIERNALIQQVAEADRATWSQFLPE